MVINGFMHPFDANGVKLKISHMNENQRKDHKNLHESRNSVLQASSYSKL